MGIAEETDAEVTLCYRNADLSKCRAENKRKFAEHVEFFRAHGCELVQGHYFSRAVPESAFGELLRAGAGVPVS